MPVSEVEMTSRNEPPAGASIGRGYPVNEYAFLLLVKRAIDLVGSAILILLLSPVLLVLAILVLLDDGPPIIHRRRPGASCGF